MSIGIGMHCWYCEHGPCTGICKEDMCQESPFTNLIEEAKMKARYNEVTGNLITLAKKGEFDVIAHGCNCFCTMGAGIAPHMAREFGDIDYEHKYLWFKHPAVTEPGIAYPMNSKTPGQPDVKDLIVVNAYTQYNYGANHKDGVAKPVDYEAITMCMRKINVAFKGKHIGLPKIGAGLAGGDWDRIKKIIQTELIDCKVTIVILPQ